MKLLEKIKNMVQKIDAKHNDNKTRKLEFKKNCEYLKPNWAVNDIFDTSAIGYSNVFLASEYYHKLKGEPGLISKVRRAKIYRYQKLLINDMEGTKHITLTALSEFAKFYYGIRTIVPSDKIYASFAYRPYSSDEPHFILKLKTKTDVITPTEVRIRDKVNDRSNMEISTTKQIAKNRDVTTTESRMFFNRAANEAYDNAWYEICNYFRVLFEAE